MSGRYYDNIAGFVTDVPDVRVRSSDAEFVLEDDDFDLRWTEEERSLRWFRVDGSKTVDVYAETLDKQDRQRIAKIKRWAKRHGGLGKAIHENPILAFDDGEVIDGTHRLVVALQQGLLSVTTLVAHRDS